jgi:hypothetical protein
VGLVVGFGVFMFVLFWFFSRSGQSQGLAGTSGGPLANGTPARAILLSVASTGWRRNYSGFRYEVRDARVDIEEPGVPPYELAIQLYIPGNLVRDALPGSTMEVRLNRGDRRMLVVVGPDVGYTQGAVRTS